MGSAPSAANDVTLWPAALSAARARVLATAETDMSTMLPAWRPYTGTFYQHARPALAAAVRAGHLIIISGGHGIVHADEPIGCYDKQLRLADWPLGLLNQPSSAKSAAPAPRGWWRLRPPPPSTRNCCGRPHGGTRGSAPTWSLSPVSVVAPW